MTRPIRQYRDAPFARSKANACLRAQAEALVLDSALVRARAAALRTQITDLWEQVRGLDLPTRRQ
jgi:hypothetical protein